mmetsp:Transcript_16353/g.30973  ORF Transcript_16353/g.30973 Transcript_16353/m.30973 type:complete len:89 (+) Transcript_16353:1426-1692(+)
MIVLSGTKYFISNGTSMMVGDIFIADHKHCKSVDKMLSPNYLHSMWIKNCTLSPENLPTLSHVNPYSKFHNLQGTAGVLVQSPCIYPY